VLDDARHARRATLRPIEPVDPALLLGSAFLPYVGASDRLRRQLDVVAAIAATVPVFAVDAARSAGPGAAADAVIAHARGVLAGATA
jgi:hypothetical protein